MNHCNCSDDMVISRSLSTSHHFASTRTTKESYWTDSVAGFTFAFGITAEGTAAARRRLITSDLLGFELNFYLLKLSPNYQQNYLKN